MVALRRAPVRGPTAPRGGPPAQDGPRRGAPRWEHDEPSAPPRRRARGLPVRVRARTAAPRRPPRRDPADRAVRRTGPGGGDPVGGRRHAAPPLPGRPAAPHAGPAGPADAPGLRPKVRPRRRGSRLRTGRRHRTVRASGRRRRGGHRGRGPGLAPRRPGDGDGGVAGPGGAGASHPQLQRLLPRREPPGGGAVVPRRTHRPPGGRPRTGRVRGRAGPPQRHRGRARDGHAAGVSP